MYPVSLVFLWKKVASLQWEMYTPIAICVYHFHQTSQEHNIVHHTSWLTYLFAGLPFTYTSHVIPENKKKQCYLEILDIMKIFLIKIRLTYVAIMSCHNLEPSVYIASYIYKCLIQNILDIISPMTLNALHKSSILL